MGSLFNRPVTYRSESIAFIRTDCELVILLVNGPVIGISLEETSTVINPSNTIISARHAG